MRLFRPVGLEELRLLYEAEMRAFPARLVGQPIFYPVLNEPYARQIAETWNTKSGSLAGFVTRFEVESDYVSRFERRIVGTREHEELWVPAEELDEFNQNLEGRVTVVASYFGTGYSGLVPQGFGLRGKTAREQFLALARTLPYSGMDFTCEIAANHVAMFLNFYFWEQADFTREGITLDERDHLLGSIRERWETGAPRGIPLGIER